MGEDLDDFVSLTNSPLASTPYYRRYQLAFVGNVAEAAPMDFINVPLDVFRKAAVDQLTLRPPNLVRLRLRTVLTAQGRHLRSWHRARG